MNVYNQLATLLTHNKRTKDNKRISTASLLMRVFNINTCMFNNICKGRLRVLE